MLELNPFIVKKLRYPNVFGIGWAPFGHKKSFKGLILSFCTKKIIIYIYYFLPTYKDSLDWPDNDWLTLFINPEVSATPEAVLAR